MKYLLVAPYPCLIKSKTESVELDQNDTLECENEELLYVYPLTQSLSPFCVNLSAKADTEHYSFLKHGEKNIVFLEKVPKFDVFAKEELIFPNKRCKIYVGENEIKFETDKKIIRCHRFSRKSSPKIVKIKNFACVAFDDEFFAYAVSTDKLSHFQADEISLKNNVLTLTKKYRDSQCREKFLQYEILDEIKLKNEQIISNETKLIDRSLAPFKFLECVKAGDYANFKKFFSASLSEKLNEEKIKSFFGQAHDFLPLSPNEFLAVSSASKSYVSFDVEDGVIADISIDSL
jgi:hypothetical protein